MQKVAIAVHGGASVATPFLKTHLKESEAGLKEAIENAYQLLKKGCSAIEAVELAISNLEDNLLFNAGRGSALNCRGEVEMDAGIMDGKELRAGAVSMVKNVKNPIILAHNVMTKTKHVFLSGYGALEFAKSNDIILEPDSYFVTDHQNEEFIKENNCLTTQQILEKKIGSTVGAVALDQKGDIAAGTSSGGTNNCLPGRIGDSCVIGAGCYANNQTCAVSGTGDGEILMTSVIAHTIALLIEFKNVSLQEACDYVILKRQRPIKGEIGVIALNTKGEIGMSFNTEIMKRAWIGIDGKVHVKIY